MSVRMSASKHACMYTYMYVGFDTLKQFLHAYMYMSIYIQTSESAFVY